MEDYYKILGVKKDVSNKELRKVYKNLAVKWHPDKNINNKEEAEKKFKKIAEAYQILSDPEKRDVYDKYGKSGLDNNFGNENFFHRGNVSAEDLFTQFFNSNDHPQFGFQSFFNGPFNDPFRHGPNSSSNGNYQNHQQSGFKNKIKKEKSMKINVNCTLEELYNGIEKKQVYIRNVYSNGRAYKEKKDVIIKIQPGWRKGTKVTFSDIGNIHQNMKPSDVIFIIDEEKHNIYKREDDDLIIKCNVELYNALNGFSTTLMTLNGKTKTVEMGPLTKKMEHRISGDGMPIRKNGKIVGYGDIIIRFHINLSNIPYHKKQAIKDLLKET
jgi:DnaJ family protein B protein 4